MSAYRDSLPQLAGEPFLTDAGVETDLIFNHGIEVREFAAHTLLQDRNGASGRDALARYFHGFFDLARDAGTGFVLDSQTWKAHRHWAADLGATVAELRSANHDSIGFIADLRAARTDVRRPIALNAVVGPRGDAYAPEAMLAIDEAERYHAEQVAWLAETEADMITATTFTQAEEAAGPGARRAECRGDALGGLVHGGDRRPAAEWSGRSGMRSRPWTPRPTRERRTT